MTQPQPTPTPPGGAARARGPLAAVAVIMALLAIGAVVAWFVLIRSDAPPEVGLRSSSPATSTDPGTSPSDAVPTPSSSPSGAPAASGGSDAVGDGISGTWTIDPTIGSFSDFSSSFVGYRMEEQLAGIGANTAVGRTPNVTGSMTIDGTTVTAATFEADLTTLKSDDDRRDGQLRRRGLETDTYPTASFALTQPIDLGRVPADGEVLQVTATGDLTLHGQTRSVQVPLETKIESGVITVTGSLPIVLSDYGMQAPESFVVLSIADQGTMELQLHLTRG